MLFCPLEQIRATDRLYVISRGIVIHGATILRKNQCFGVDFLLTQEHLRVNLATVALSYLHTMYLTRDALQRTLDRHPRERQLVRRSYRALCLMRGIVYFAKQVLAKEKREARHQAGLGEEEQEPEKKVDFLDRIG